VKSAPSERSIVFLIGAVQFINILDFMMVMPLGPDFAGELGIDASNLGIIGGAYTGAAAVAGLIGALFLDRFDRRSALLVTMLGLMIGTAAGGFATGLHTLVFARIVAGAFGGPATSIAISIVTDVVPPVRRGRAMGAVMGAFSAASVLGLPAGLELAQLGGWRTPFFAVAGLGVPIVALVGWWLPPLTGHFARMKERGQTSIFTLVRRTTVSLTLMAAALAMMSSFLIIPNISAWVQFNGGYPREHLGMLYLTGGVVSFFVMRFAGLLVDRHGSVAVAAFGCLLLSILIMLGFGFGRPLMPVMLLFVSFMVAQSFRNVACSTLYSKVPRSHERARYQSVQSAVQHLACSAGAILSAQMLREGPGHRLEGMTSVAVLSTVLTLLLPLALRGVARCVAAEPVLSLPPPPPGPSAGAAAAPAATTE
jgi:predicted MFS family arabinose efflux permease